MLVMIPVMPVMYSCYDRCVITTIAFIRFYFGFPVLCLLYYTRSCLAFPLIFYSTSLLLLLYYTMCLSMLATWHSYHHSPGEFYLTPLDPHVQVTELGACGFSQLLIRVAQLKRGSPADRPELYPSRPPCVPLEFSFCKLVSAFYTVHSCTFLCILAFAPIGDVILL